MMPSILFLSKAPPYRHTGAEQVIWNVGTHLARNEWEVHFLCPDGGDRPDIKNINFHCIPTTDSFFAEKALFFLKGIPAYHKVRKSIDTDIVYDNASPFPFLYAYVTDRNRLVTKVHAVYGLSALQNKDHPITKVGTVIGEQMYRLLDGRKLLAISHSTKQRLSRRVRKNPEEITVVNNGIDVSQFTYRFSPQGPILSLCELTPRKNVEMLLRAWAIVESEGSPMRDLIIAGDGPRRDELEQLAKELSLSNIKFVGFVSEKKKLDLYQEAFSYVLSTRMEGFGLTNLEAMASGCVVVSTDVPGVRDYLIDGDNGYLVPSDDHKSLARQLLSLLEDSEAHSGISASGRLCAEQYDLTESVEQEREILEKRVDT